MWRPLAQKYNNTEEFGSPWATASLFTALSLSKECLMWVSTHCGRHLPPEGTLWQSTWECNDNFSADSLLFWSSNKSILQGWLQPKFRKRRKKKKDVGEFSLWMLSRSLKCHVSAPDTHWWTLKHSLHLWFTGRKSTQTQTDSVCVCMWGKRI